LGDRLAGGVAENGRVVKERKGKQPCCFKTAERIGTREMYEEGDPGLSRNGMRPDPAWRVT
jgi:hypothetical protein